MPRHTRLMPIAMPTGMAVTQASRKAENTRNMLARKCCHSGLSLAWPVRYSLELLEHRLRRRQEQTA